MSGSEGETAEGCLESIVLSDAGAGISRRLVMRPKGFFSNKFEMVVESDDAAPGPAPALGRARIFSPKRLALAALIGVPILIYAAA